MNNLHSQFIVCVIDFIYPPKPAFYPTKRKQKDGSGGFMQEKLTGDEELVKNVKDDLVDEDASGLEEDKDDDDNDDDNDEEEEEEETEEVVEEEKKSAPSSPNVRKRKPRKAD